MPKNIKVSVVLTSFNHEKYLRESIESVLNQTYSDFELIIWDDASTDGSWEIINSYKDARIQGFRNEINQRGSINKALSRVKGEYIAIHHSDDVWEPEKLNKQVSLLDRHPEIGAVFTHVTIIGENGELFADKSNPYYLVFDQPNRNRYEWLNFFFYYGNALCHPSVLIRKKCYDDSGFYRPGLAQIPDFDMWVRICMKYEIYIIPEKLIRFRLRGNEMNASGNRPDTRIRGHFELLQVLNNYRFILTFSDLEKIFPEAQQYLKADGCDLSFALGMIAIGAKLSNVHVLFGLLVLFEALNDPIRAKKISDLYNFKPNDIIALTGQFDIFSVEQTANLIAQVTERELSVQALTAQAAERELSVQALTAQAAEREQSVQALTAQAAEREQEKSTLMIQLALSQEEVLAYALSGSWQITRPIRRFVKFIRGIKNA